jgi:hypothetical protein
MSVTELEAKMGDDELREWYEYYALEPFGEIRADYRAALVCLIAAKCAGNKDSKLNDFLLFKEVDDDEAKSDLDDKIVKAFLKV